MLFRKSLILVFLSLFCSNLFGQAKLLSPNQFLPNTYGKEFTPHHALVDYYEYVAENSPNVQLEQYGWTNEKRPLIYAVVTSPENFKKLEEIRLNNLRRTGLIEGAAKDDNIAVVWMSFGVHGNEAGASESSLATLYDLVRSDNPNAKEWLKNTVVILDPSINPDGFSRYTHWNWNAGNSIPNILSEAMEHHEPWPGGRVNHYMFDLNRDWAWLTQVESQQRLKIYHKWMPHIHVDFHEQYHNDPYYFAPAAQPYHAYITQWQGDFQTTIGKNNAKYFDENGWLYFTREIFDLFYPSYGDTYPTFNGAVGMTYEQGGHSMAGRAILLNNGDTLQLQDRIDHHKTTALSTVETAANNAKDLTDQFQKYFATSSQSPKGEYKSFVIKAGNAPEKMEYLMKFLDSHGIRYGKAGTSKNGVQGFDFIAGKTKSVNIDPEDMVISAYQPMSVLTQVLFEPEPFLVDSLTYDITAWALPYAHGLDAYALKSDVKPNGKFELEKFRPTATTGKKAYAYATSWETLKDMSFLKALQDKGVSVRSASEGFEIGDEKFERGTLLINRGDNRRLGKTFDEIVLETANEFSKKMSPLKTGFARIGRDLGSDKMRLLKNPKIMLLAGRETYQNSYGHLWHFFDQELGIQTTSVYAHDIRRTDLGDYNVLVLTDGSYQSIDSAAMAKITDWVKAGGKLIALGTAINKLAGFPAFKITKKVPLLTRSHDDHDHPKHTHYAGQERRSIANAIPGAIFKVKIDNTHPLGYGMNDYYYSLKTSSAAYDYSESGWNVGYLDDEPQVAGFVGFNAQKKLRNTSVFTVQPMGRGQVVYMIDNPLFRGFWREGKFLFGNAIFML